MKRKIGIFGGTFDPIHIGHLNLAVQLMEKHGLDEVWFCPVAINPFKKEKGCCASAHDRIEMIKLAIAGEPRFKIIDIEINRIGPSYTIDTLRQLDAQTKKDPPTEFYLLMGEDAADHFYQWRDTDSILNYCRLIVGMRSLASNKESIKGTPEIIEAIKNGFTPINIMEISSTNLRLRLAKRLFCGHLLPGKVMDYILANGLYLASI